MNTKPILSTTTVLLGIALASPVLSGDLELSVSQIKEATGTVRIALYNSEASFRKEVLKGVSPPAVMGVTTAVFKDLPNGEYAAVAYHDTNNNEKMDTNLFGVPKEPWGASFQGNAVSAPPKWDRVKFVVKDGANKVDVLLND